jgi:hypothetical protein
MLAHHLAALVSALVVQLMIRAGNGAIQQLVIGPHGPAER